MDIDYKNQLLTTALDARVKEVTEYQVNIDNFKLAIDRIGEDPDLQEFKGYIQNMLSSSVIEQRKAQVMLEVVQSQITGT